MNKNICIIGGAGFIGHHLIKEFQQRNQTVVLYDDLSVGRSESFEMLGVTGIHGSILDNQLLVDTLKKKHIEEVFHLAAIHHIPTCENNPEKALRINIEGTQSVFNACSEAGVKKVVFASSGAVYDLKDGPISESYPLLPRDIYGISKIAGENLVRYFFQKTGIPVIITRFFNTVGTKETNDHLVPEIIKKLKLNQTQIELGNLEPKRDYIHVRDIASALFSLSKYKVPNNVEIFNIGSGVEYSVKEVVQKIEKILGHKIKLVSSSKLCRKSDRLHQLSDSSKLREKTGWVVKNKLEYAIKEMLQEAELI